MKSVAILGFLGLITITTVAITHKPQHTEPIVSGSQTTAIEPVSTPQSPVLVSPTPTPEVKATKPAPIKSVKTVDLIAPVAPEDLQKQIDQSTIKNIEQDSRLDNLDTKQVVPTPTPVDQKAIEAKALADHNAMCQAELDHKNAELFKYKTNAENILNKLQQGIDQTKASYKVRLSNAYGNQPLWDSINAEMDDNSSKWQALTDKIMATLNASEAQINALPVCADY